VSRWEITLKDNTSELDTVRAKKVKISISLDSGLVDWIDKEVDKFTFQNRSDGIEKAVVKLKAELEKQKT
jgi:Arc/MetJ-type ribon-helix-helix transcriptional regulator